MFQNHIGSVRGEKGRESGSGAWRTIGIATVMGVVVGLVMYMGLVVPQSSQISSLRSRLSLAEWLRLQGAKEVASLLEEKNRIEFELKEALLLLQRERDDRLVLSSSPFSHLSLSLCFSDPSSFSSLLHNCSALSPALREELSRCVLSS
eukprot:TRINITY_DN16575_c0_g1_i1.p2 TRINITY_DN16575_c0_g1~~TRINITY_DN16575_c0_g1_i1.p2  ORF type:complete len:168 (+),score=61.51 TRINITY_DN16575_c0_g1_i1:58-504(+)